MAKYTENKDYNGKYVLLTGRNKGDCLDKVPLKDLDRYRNWLTGNELYGNAKKDYFQMIKYLSIPIIKEELEKCL